MTGWTEHGYAVIPAGVGKTTTVRALAGLLRADNRSVHLTGEPPDGPIGKLTDDLTETRDRLERHMTALSWWWGAGRRPHRAPPPLGGRCLGAADDA
jgi:hypothetical protein